MSTNRFDDSKFSQLIENFKNKAKRIENGLAEVADEIKQGRVPKQECVSRYTDDIDNLRADFCQIREMSINILDVSEVPSENAGIDEYQKAVQGCRWLQELAEARERLEKFIKIHSDLQEYLDALKPYQEKAKTTLAKLDNNLLKEPEFVTDDMNRKDVLRTIVEGGDSLCDECLFDKLRHVYGHKVALGLAGNKYRIEEGDIVNGNVESEIKEGDEKIRTNREISVVSDFVEEDAKAISTEEKSLKVSQHDTPECQKTGEATLDASRKNGTNMSTGAEKGAGNVSKEEQSSSLHGKLAESSEVGKVYGMAGAMAKTLSENNGEEMASYEQAPVEQFPKIVEEIAVNGTDLSETQGTMQNALSENNSADKTSKKEKTIINGFPSTIATGILTQKEVPSNKEIQGLIERLLNTSPESGIEDSNILHGLLMARSYSFRQYNPHLYHQILLATSFPLETEVIPTLNLEQSFEENNLHDEKLQQVLKYCACCNVLLKTHTAYEKSIIPCIAGHLNRQLDCLPPKCWELWRELLHPSSLNEKDSWKGFSEEDISLLLGENEIQQKLQKLQSQAQEIKVPRYKANMKGLPDFATALFGIDSKLGKCITIIEQNEDGKRNEVKKVLHEICNSHSNSDCDDRNIGEYIDATWSAVTKNMHQPGKLIAQARMQTDTELRKRLELMRAWLEIKESNISNKMTMVRSKLSQLVDEALAELQGMAEAMPYKAVVVHMLGFQKAYLTGKHEIFFSRISSDLLRTGYLPLNAQGYPDEQFSASEQVKYYEDWRNLLKHISEPHCQIEEAVEAISNDKSASFDNFGQLKLIAEKHPELLRNYQEKFQTVMCLKKSDGLCSNNREAMADLQEAKRRAEKLGREFTDKLALAYTCGTCPENDEEKLRATMDIYNKFFMDNWQLGCWKQFKEALDHQLEDIKQCECEKVRKAVEKMLIFSSVEEKLWLNAALRQIEAGNVATAEEYQAHAINHDVYSQFVTQNTNVQAGAILRDFISVYENIRKICNNAKSGRQMKKFDIAGKEFVKSPQNKNKTKDWTSRHYDSSEKLLSNWLKVFTPPTVQLPSLLEEFGLDPKRVSPIPGCDIQGSRVRLYKGEMQATQKNLRDYPHPISAFGTRLKELTVVTMRGSHGAEDLLNVFNTLQLTEPTIFMVDTPLSMDVRRKFGAQIRRATVRVPVVLVDQVLCMYLALYDRVVRMSVLLQCALPFSVYQPFGKGGGATDDEMFFGRVKELTDIIDFKGTCIVYGGRQLGKTALLKRAAAIEMQPENKKIALYVNLFDCPKNNIDEAEQFVARQILASIKDNTLLETNECSNLRELSRFIDDIFKKGQCRECLLLLDEADHFMEAIGGEAHDYSILLPLIELWKTKYDGRFKFVLAGTHNVCRASNLGRNSVLGQLPTPLCIEPLSGRDALNLLLKPLQYLGILLDDTQCAAILTNTNYYPGIIQLVGHNIVEYYGREDRYDIDSNPPFELPQNDLGTIIVEKDIREGIKEKFNWSLILDERYKALALHIAFLVYTKSPQTEFTQDEIMESNNDIPLTVLQKEQGEDIADLLEEMVKMGVLAKRDSEKKYHFRRTVFVSYVSEENDILGEFDKLNDKYKS